MTSPVTRLFNTQGAILSVQCNTLHETEYKITCGVFLCLVCVSACAHGFWVPIISKTVKEVRFQWDTNKKWYMADRLVTWPMTSRDLERSRSWPRYIWGPLSRKWLETETQLQWSTYRKWHLAVTWPMTSRELERKIKVVTSICLGLIISKMAGDRDSDTMGHLQEMAPVE